MITFRPAAPKTSMRDWETPVAMMTGALNPTKIQMVSLRRKADVARFVEMPVDEEFSQNYLATHRLALESVNSMPEMK
ncbi:hypothetical protein ACFB49_30700 [Sphingomonas sp. DBB INV C78]|uniref:hypothetical protein n=1 Tax=Sphingomonas sp. DBB INV C78 TaxID=3349434 RepID=UPI0036D3EBF3